MEDTFSKALYDVIDKYEEKNKRCLDEECSLEQREWSSGERKQWNLGYLFGCRAFIGDLISDLKAIITRCDNPPNKTCVSSSSQEVLKEFNVHQLSLVDKSFLVSRRIPIAYVRSDDIKRINIFLSDASGKSISFLQTIVRNSRAQDYEVFVLKEFEEDIAEILKHLSYEFSSRGFSTRTMSKLDNTCNYVLGFSSDKSSICIANREYVFSLNDNITDYGSSKYYYLLIGGTYLHFKGTKYRVLDIAVHSETRETYVVYRSVSRSDKACIRLLSMFLSAVDKTKYPSVKQIERFKLIE